MKPPSTPHRGASLRSLVLGLALGLSAPPVRAAESPAPESKPAASDAAAPTNPENALAAAKVSEEGDRDFDRAAKEYHAVVDQYDAGRRQAAEALFRFAEVARKLGHVDDARQAYTRLTREFVGVGDFATRSQRRLAEIDPPETPSPGFSMSPELMRRYGLLPRTAPDPAAVEESAQPAPGVGGGAGGSTSSSPATTRYGTGFGASSRSGGAGGVGSSSLADPALRAAYGPAVDELTMLRSEAAELSARLRKIRRERRAAEVERYDLFPVALIEDQELVALVRERSRCELKLRAANAEGRAEATREAEQARKVAQDLMESYRQTLRERLGMAERMLEEELQGLSAEMARVKAERSTTGEGRR